MIKHPKAYARFAGLNYALIFALAIYANFFIFSKLLVGGDAAATAANIAENETLFRIGLACFFGVMIADIFISWALYFLMQPVSVPLSMLSSIFRLAYTIAQIGVLMNLAKALQIAGEPEIYGAIGDGAWPYFFTAAHNGEFTLTLIFFGLHLLLLGFLIIRAPYLPALIGLLVSVAGLGYIADGFAEILFGGYGPLGDISTYVVIVPALIGEGMLMLWLLAFGVNRKKWYALAK